MRSEARPCWRCHRTRRTSASWSPKRWPAAAPVLVSTHVNLADEIAEANAGWVVPLERSALRETLSRVLREDAERGRRGQAGRELATARFRWTSVAGEVSRRYQSLAEAS